MRWKIRRFLASYGFSLPIMFLGLVLLVFLVNVDAMQIPAVRQGGAPAVAFWEMLSDILVVVASAFLSIGGMMIGNVVQNQHRQQQEIRQFRRQIAQEYRDYLTWLLKTGHHADFVQHTPRLREKLPERGRSFDISPEMRAKIIEKMPLIWQFSSIYNDEDRDVCEAVDAAIQSAFNYLSVAGNEGESAIEYHAVRQAYNIAMQKLTEYEYRL